MLAQTAAKTDDPIRIGAAGGIGTPSAAGHPFLLYTARASAYAQTNAHPRSLARRRRVMWRQLLAVVAPEVPLCGQEAIT